MYLTVILYEHANTLENGKMKFNDISYTSASEVSNRMGEHRDCAVKAISIATGTDYATVHAMLKAAGRRNRCGTYRFQTDKVIKELGFRQVNVTSQVCGRTVRTVAGELRNGNYLVFVSGHVLAVKEGVVEDWTAGRQHRVKDIMKIVPEDSVEEARIVAPVAVQAPRGTVTQRIYTAADAAWAAIGSPRNEKLVRRMRVQLMNELEQQGIKRTTASSTLGTWWKTK